jgi:hypothetical protein
MAAEAAARAEATRQRLAEAAAAKEAAAAAAAAAARGGARESYRAGKLSADEKAARLAAMMGNADEHEAQRRERLQKVRVSLGEVGQFVGVQVAISRSGQMLLDVTMVRRPGRTAKIRRADVADADVVLCCAVSYPIAGA